MCDWLESNCEMRRFEVLCAHEDHEDVELVRHRDQWVVKSYGRCYEEKCPKMRDTEEE